MKCGYDKNLLKRQSKGSNHIMHSMLTKESKPNMSNFIAMAHLTAVGDSPVSSDLSDDGGGSCGSRTTFQSQDKRA
jgi:hypothetical protein